MKSLFASAITRDPGQWSAFLAQSGEEESLLKEVEALLADYQNSTATMDDVVSPSTATSTVNPGKVLSGRYQIVRMIGQGGMGEVYEAQDLELRTKVALKLIRPEIASQADMLDRFKREVHLARKVTHPNVCRIFDLGFHAPEQGEKLAFLTMELLAGETIAQRLSRAGPMKTAEALPLVEQMAEGLNAAHQAGVIHRDFKSANTILVATGPESGATIKITDFGLARALSTHDSLLATLTGPAMFAGTPAYMAPEQVEGSELTPAADIYALGVVIYEMVTGKLPFVGDSPWSTAVKRLKNPPTPPRVHVPGLDPNWEAAILRCLEREPAARFPTSLDLATALQGQPVRQSQPIDSETKGLPTVRIGVSLLVILLALAAGYNFFRKPSRNGASPAQSNRALVAQHGWRASTLSPDPSLLQVSTAVSFPASLQVLLFGPSVLRVWEPGGNVQPPISTPISVAGQAECSAGLWLVDDDNQHITQWDPEKQKPLRTFTSPTRFRSASCLDADASRWGFLTDDAHSSRWIEFDAKANRTLRTVPLSGSFVKATVDPQRRYLALLSGENFVSIRRLDRLDEIFRDTLAENLLTNPASSWSSSGRYLSLGFKQLIVYDVQNKRRVGTLPTSGWIRGAGWISDQGLSAMDDRGRFYWTSDPSKNWEFTQDASDASVYLAFWIPSQYRWLSVGQAGQVRAWDYATPSLLFDWPISPLNVWSIAPSPNGPTVAVSGKDPKIYIGDIRQQKIVQTLEGHTDGVPFVRFDPSGKRLISASDDSTLRAWDPAGGKLLQTTHGHDSLVNAFAISPDGQWLVSVASDHKIKLWHVADLSFANDVGITSNAGAAAAFPLGDSRHLLISDWHGGLSLYQGDAPNWSLQQHSRLGKSVIYMLCSGREAWWAVVPDGDAMGLWSVPLKDLGHPTQISASPANYCFTSSDGQLTAVVYWNQVELRSNHDGTVVATYYFSAQEAFSVAIQPTPPTVLVGQGNGHLLAWPLPAKALRAESSSGGPAPPRP